MITFAFAAAVLWLSVAAPAQAANAARQTCDGPCVLLELVFNEYIPTRWSIPFNSVPQDFDSGIGNATDVSKIIVRAADGAAMQDVSCTGTWSTTSGSNSSVSFNVKEYGTAPSDGTSLIAVACGAPVTSPIRRDTLTANIWVYTEEQEDEPTKFNVSVDGQSYDLTIRPSDVNSIYLQGVFGGADENVVCHTKWSIGQGEQTTVPLTMLHTGLAPEADATLTGFQCTTSTKNLARQAPATVHVLIAFMDAPYNASGDIAVDGTNTTIRAGLTDVRNISFTDATGVNVQDVECFPYWLWGYAEFMGSMFNTTHPTIQAPYDDLRLTKLQCSTVSAKRARQVSTSVHIEIEFTDADYPASGDILVDGTNTTIGVGLTHIRKLHFTYATGVNVDDVLCIPYWRNDTDEIKDAAFNTSEARVPPGGGLRLTALQCWTAPAKRGRQASPTVHLEIDFAEADYPASGDIPVDGSNTTLGVGFTNVSRLHFNHATGVSVLDVSCTPFWFDGVTEDRGIIFNRREPTSPPEGGVILTKVQCWTTSTK